MNRIECTCLQCGIMFKDIPRKGRRRLFCSNRCFRAHYYRRHHPDVQRTVGRFSGLVYDNDRQTLDSIKDKYKDGVKLSHLYEMFNMEGGYGRG